MEVVGLLVGEIRVADHEVVEARGVVAEVDAVAIALRDERGERRDPSASGLKNGILKRSKPRAAPVSAIARRYSRSLLSPACAITIRRGSTPAFVNVSSASSPVCATAFVCTITGTPVSTAAAAIASRIRGTSPMIPWRSTQHLRNAALTPVSSIPSRISRTKNSAIASVLR